MAIKKVCGLLLIVVLFICGCSTTPLENAGKDLEDTIENAIDQDNEYVLMVKHGHDENHPSVTYEEALERYFESPGWKHFESDEGKNIVEFTGEMSYDNAPVKARIQFTLDVPAESFQPTYLAFNEVPQKMGVLYEILDEALTDAEIATIAEATARS